ncbi:hypothetical protein E0K89_002710 [Aquicoccus sp. SCR17]|nr:hypothetical protein [Carideicomes alvinocaridis]
MTTVSRPEGDLRTQLRSFTRDSHERLDARLARYDLTDPEDRQRFCAIQYRGFSDLGDACGWDAAEATSALRDIHAALAVELGLPVSRSSDPSTRPLHPDAVAYVTLGSQLGTEAMKRAMPEEQRRGAFGLAPDSDAWRAFRTRIAEDPGDEASRQRILDDARAAFDIFLAASGTDFSRENENSAI